MSEVAAMKNVHARVTLGPQHPRVVKAAEEVERAMAVYAEAIASVRLECAHEKVVEREGGSYGADLGHHNAIRICTLCGLEEHEWSGRFGWSGKLKTEYLKRTPFGSNEVYQYRPRWGAEEIVRRPTHDERGERE